MEFNGTFLVTIISFLLFVFLMNKILYAPIRNIVEIRQEMIDDNYTSADKNNQKAEELNTERENKLVEAKDDARKQYNEIIGDFKSQRTAIIQTAQTEATQELENEYNNLNSVSNEAKEVLKSRMTDLANDIVEKVLGYRSEIHGFDNDKVNEILYSRKG